MPRGRQVISAFRFHSHLSPAEAAALLTTFAIAQGLSDPRRPPPGVRPGAMGHRYESPPSGRSGPLPPGCHAHAALADPDEQTAVAEVLGQVVGGGEA
jgi:hypothetical protein